MKLYKYIYIYKKNIYIKNKKYEDYIIIKEI